MNEQRQSAQVSLLPRVPRPVKLLVALAVGALLVSGCGAHSASRRALSKPALFTAAAFRYAACMREHGVASFPDPGMTDHNGQEVAFLASPTPMLASPAYPNANNACAPILPPPIKPGTAQAQPQH